MNDKPPKCDCAPCLEPSMPNSPDCAYHWRTLRGWDEALLRAMLTPPDHVWAGIVAKIRQAESEGTK